jgi:hypothetical protein
MRPLIRRNIPAIPAPIVIRRRIGFQMSVMSDFKASPTVDAAVLAVSSGGDAKAADPTANINAVSKKNWRRFMIDPYAKGVLASHRIGAGQVISTSNLRRKLYHQRKV